jgi:hypothetical protein
MWMSTAQQGKPSDMTRSLESTELLLESGKKRKNCVPKTKFTEKESVFFDYSVSAMKSFEEV